jgi:hypothetical protein
LQRLGINGHASVAKADGVTWRAIG